MKVPGNLFPVIMVGMPPEIDYVYAQRLYD